MDTLRCPYGVPGDRLWVKETWWHDEPFHMDDCEHVDYVADHEPDWHPYPGQDGVFANNVKKSALFMPRHHSRITLEITAVRVERLQNINEQDAWAEGIGEEPGLLEIDGRVLYRDVWDSINGKRCPWASNAWVWVIEFRRIEGSRD